MINFLLIKTSNIYYFYCLSFKVWLSDNLDKFLSKEIDINIYEIKIFYIYLLSFNKIYINIQITLLKSYSDMTFVILFFNKNFN